MRFCAMDEYTSTLSRSNDMSKQERRSLANAHTKLYLELFVMQRYRFGISFRANAA